MNSTTRTTLVVAAIATVGLLAGCATDRPTKMIANVNYVGDQSVRYLTDRVKVNAGEGETITVGDSGKSGSSNNSGGKKSSGDGSSSGEDGSENGGMIFDLSIEVCDLDENRDDTNCTTSRVLGNATLGGINYANQIRESRLTNMFWYDSETLYIAYMRQAKKNQANIMESDTAETPVPQVKKCRVQSDNALSCAPVEDLNKKLFIQKTE